MKALLKGSLSDWWHLSVAGVERGILDSGRDFEATGAGGSAATSEADYQHYRSPGALQNLCHCACLHA